MPRSTYLFRQLVGVAVAAGLPLMLLLAYNMRSSAEAARQQALNAIDNQAIAVAHDVDLLLQSNRQHLAYLSAQPLVRSLDPQHCDPVIAGVTERRAHLANVLVLDAQGALVCSSIHGPGTPPRSMRELAWFEQALHSRTVVISAPYQAPIAQKPVVALAQALRNGQGEAVGVAAMLLDLDSLQRTWQRFRLPPDARLSVIAEDGTMIATTPDFERWVGRNVGAVVSNALRSNPLGQGRAVGIDGVERTFARAPIPGGPWSAFAAYPTAAVLASHHAELRRSLIVAGLAIAVAVALTVLLARRLAAPLRALTATALAVRDGNTAVRADTTAAGEFGAVGAAFNAMLESLGEGMARERRQIDFYAALSRTNGAIVRIDNEPALLAEICRICVEHGHASIAYISVVDGLVARPVAWAGAAQAFLGGRSLSLDPDQPEGRGMTATAIRSGERFIVDDADTHPATLPWRAQGNAIGTRSLAAFPFRRGGRVAGALTLHMTSTHFFDAQVVALLDEMAADLSFALDHLDRVETLQAARQRLVERDQQLTGLVETAMDAIITVDAEQRIRLFNRAAAAMFGVPAGEALGGPLERFIPPRLRSVHRDHVARFVATGSTARRMGALQTLVGLRGSGEEFPIEASISTWGEGAGALLTVVIRDATELRRAEEARLARAAAESANRAKSEFLSHMSHELRTPLNAILGFSQLLQADAAVALRPAQAEQVEYIRQAGWHLMALVTDVLDVSRIEAGRLRVEPRDLDAADALGEAVRLIRGLAAQQGLVVDAPPEGGPDRITVRADAIRLRQVLVNVLSNAVKYNRPGGRVEVQLARDGARICFVVADTGLGMTPQQLQHLYEPFNRLGREHAGIEGTGLGLALTRQLVALMDGELSVRSEVDRGTRVEIRLPAGATAAVGAPLQPADGPAHRSLEPQGTVLYIEDNPVNRLLVEQMLARWPDVLLLQAEDGRSGLELARSSRPDIVLLDMRLPDMSGLQVLQALRSDSATAGIRVVALSGDAMAEDIAAARDGGADDYWTKPFDVQQFLRELALRLQPDRAPSGSA